MSITVTSSPLEKIVTDCLIVAIHKGNRLSDAADIIDQASDGYIGDMLQRGDLSEDVGKFLLLHNIPNISSKRVLLLQCGDKTQIKQSGFVKIITQMTAFLNQRYYQHVVCCLTDLAVKHHDVAWKLSYMTRELSDGYYRLDTYKSKPAKNPPQLPNIVFYSEQPGKKLSNAITQGEAIAAGVRLCKNLANTPPNITTPEYLADVAVKMAKDNKDFLTTKILNEKEMKQLKMGALLAVGQGSKNPPRLIMMHYQGGKEGERPAVFVGKGITFDTGGVNLKAALPMLGMKYDMCGGASVFGIIKAAIDLALPMNIIGVVAAAENMNDGAAFKPEDVLTTLSGQTVEVLNTDAEGRLVLCDALTYVERFDPAFVIDIATLTGAIITSLGDKCAGLFTQNNLLADALIAAGKHSYDRLWRMPLWEEYQDALKSDFADFVNSPMPSPGAGSTVAACFLSRFTEKYIWAHVDIAGVATGPGKKRRASGRPVPLMMQFLIDHLKD